MTPDCELLRQYADQRDEAAFAEVVRRHLNWVYALALRSLHGNAALAEDVTQAVFTDLARKAGPLRRHTTVAGWLHTSVRFAAAKAIRDDACRRTHEHEASAMHEPTLPHPPNAAPAELRPLLDEAVGQLREPERDAVLLRFFEDKSYREVGDLLGLSENAARMRVERALDKLRGQFSRRGVTTTAALLASALGAHGAVTPAPAGFAAAVAGKTLAGAGVRGLGAAGTHSLFAKQFLPIWVGAGSLAIVALILILHQPPPSPAKVVAPVPQNSPSPPTPMNIPPLPRRVIAAALIAATSAATGQNTVPPPAPPPPPPLFLAPASAPASFADRQAAAQAAAAARAAEIAAAPAAPDSNSYSALVTANNRFALDLFRQFNPQPNENAFFSPYSISTALAMTWAGANGDTAAQMAQVLHFSEMPLATVLANFSALQQATARAQVLSGAQLAIANSLWAEQNPEHPLLPNYLSLVQASFAASLTPVDFIHQAPAAAQQINAWVEDKTNGKIKNLVDPKKDVDADTRLVLVNALYFKGNWTNTFSPRMNANSEFHAADGSAIPTVLMNNWQDTGYANITDASVPCQILSLSYSDGPRGAQQGLSLVVILPQFGGDLNLLEKTLNADQLASWLGRLAPAEVNVYLPKFKLEEHYQLADTLQAMGIKNAFDGGLADFSGMDGIRDLFIAKVIHQTFVDVDENGTEAAAATAVVMGFGGAAPQPPAVEFRADHPFLFLIRDDISGSILFLGQLANPAPLTEQIPAGRRGARAGGPRGTANAGG